MEAVLYAPLVQWINLYRLHESGITEENEWRNEVVANAGYFYGTAYGRAWWEIQRDNFQPPFLPAEIKAEIVSARVTSDRLLKNALDIRNDIGMCTRFHCLKEKTPS